MRRPGHLFVQALARDSYHLHKHWRHLNENQLLRGEAWCQNAEAIRTFQDGRRVHKGLSQGYRVRKRSQEDTLHTSKPRPCC